MAAAGMSTSHNQPIGAHQTGWPAVKIDLIGIEGEEDGHQESHVDNCDDHHPSAFQTGGPAAKEWKECSIRPEEEEGMRERMQQKRSKWQEREQQDQRSRQD